MCGSTCFGHLSTHHHERTTALGASGFTAGEKRAEALLPVVCQTMTNNAPTATLQQQNQKLLVQLYATDDGHRCA